MAKPANQESHGQDGIEFSIHERFGTRKSRIAVWWGQGEFYLKDKKRVATLTDVKFVSDDLLVAAHRAAAKAYLIQYRDGAFTLLDELRLNTARGCLNPRKRFSPKRFFHPDLMSVSGNLIYMTEYTWRCCVIEIRNNKLRYKKTIGFKNPTLHGCYADSEMILFGSCSNGKICTYNPKTGNKKPIATGLDDGLRIKTIGKEQPNYLLLGTDKITGSTAERGAMAETSISLHRTEGHTFTLLDTFDLPNTQIDGHAYSDGLHYFSIQDAEADTGHLAVFKVENDRLQLVKKIPCHLFPHGLDIRHGKLVYTSYTRSSISVIDLKSDS